MNGPPIFIPEQKNLFTPLFLGASGQNYPVNKLQQRCKKAFTGLHLLIKCLHHFFDAVNGSRVYVNQRFITFVYRFTPKIQTLTHKIKKCTCVQ